MARSQRPLLASVALLAATAGVVSFVMPAGQEPSPEGGRRAAVLGLVAAAQGAQMASAAEPAAAPSPWAGNYKDPQHPGCMREVTVDGRYLTITGTDGIPGPGCEKTADFSNLKSLLDPAPVKEWSLTATIKFKKENEASIDFSPKGGPKDLLGVLEADGIKFPDGNKWTKTSR
mmetsp:Transcript_90020/g.194771  ORF Transcript_90020/g.194771 Transcript_90020/m.194771 type:complete len:174 (+) Transcript_90020:84-605(+)